MAAMKSVKHLQIDKAKSRMLIVIAVAAALSVFSLYTTKLMISKANYQRKAINEKHKVVKQLKDNISASSSLINQYKLFADQNPNVLGGSVTGSGPLDGDNGRITLDALPSKYDAPALATSIEKILLDRGVAIQSIDIIDDQASNPDQPSAKPEPAPLTFSFEAGSDYKNSQLLIKDFERSIRPFDVTSLELTGTDTSLRVKAGVTTYYQAPKSLSLTITKEVK
jgi:hypothetical protein